MRESVKNKRKLIVTAVAVIIAMLLSVTTGLLIYSPKGNSTPEGITDGLMGNVADSVNLDNSTTGKTNPDGTSGDRITTQAELKSAIQNNSSCYLANDVELDWGSGKPNSNSYTGTFNGNGKVVRLRTSSDGWPMLDTWTGSGDNYYGAGFVGVLAPGGVIKNVTFEYKSLTWKFASPTAWHNGKKNTIATFGLVCGENRGTIQNVRLDIDSAKVEMHADTFADEEYANKLLLGGICGAQSGTLNNAYVNITGNTELKVNTKNWRNTNGGYRALQMGIIGGVYGAYTSATAALNTSNLMMKGGSGVILTADSEPGGSGWSQNDGVLNFCGAVAGYNIQGVKGVVWDYQGSFWVRAKSANGATYSPSDFESSKVAAMTGIPNGYYSPTATIVCANGSEWLSNSNERANYLLSGYGKNDMPTNSSVNWGMDTSDAKRGKIDRSFGKAKIDMAQYDAKFGSIEMKFTNDPGYLNIKRTMTGYGTFDCFFRVGTCATDAISSNPAVYYGSDNNKAFDVNFNMATDNMAADVQRFEIVTGKRLSGSTYGIQLLGNQSYTGNDYLTLFKNNAISAAAREKINEVKVDTNVVFDTSLIKILENDKVISGWNLIYPKRAAKITIQSTVDPDYAYVDHKNRFCFAPTAEMPNLQMLPARNTVTVPNGWGKTQTINVLLRDDQNNTSNRIQNNAVDRVEYRIVGTTVFKSQAVTHTAANGFSFTISDSTPLAGAQYEIIGYKNDNPVVFSQFDDAGAVVPLNLGKNVFVDNIAPTMDDSQFDYLHETNVWFNADKTVEFEVADANSGVKTVDVFKTALDNQGNPIIGSYPERINSTLQNNRVTFTADGYNKYHIKIYDQADNTKDYEFNAHIDKTNPDITADIEYYIKKITGGTDPYDPSKGSTKSVFATIRANFGPAGGKVYFEAANQPDNELNTKGTVIQSTNNVFDAEIKTTMDGGTAYNFTLISNAVATKGDESSSLKKTINGTVVIIVKQETIEVLIADINITSDNGDLTEVYSKSNGFDTSRISVRFSDETRKQTAKEKLEGIDAIYDIEQFNTYIEVVSAGFYSDKSGNNPVTDANEGRDAKYYLLVHIRVKSIYDFAITNQQSQNNFYVFEANAVDDEGNAIEYQINNTLQTVETVGIQKKVINDMTVDYIEKTYWEPNPDFSVTLGAGELVSGDTIDDVKITYHTNATKESNAGRYDVTATIDEDCINYKLASNANTRGDFRIKRAVISNIYIDGELNSISCFETPNVKAYFYDATGIKTEAHRIYLDIIYKNQDKEEFEFIPGKRAPIGKYFYVILIDDANLINYVNLSDPNMLIGHFSVVGDNVEEGRNFFIRDLDPTTSVIEVEFINGFIDFRSLLDFDENALRDKMMILYGANEVENTIINEIGYYIVTLKIKRGDDRYAPFTKEYEIKVVPATIIATNDDVKAPNTPVEEGQVSIDGVYFDNKVVNLTIDSISKSLRDKLEALLTEEEIANGGVTKYYDFDFTYKLNNRTVSASNVINVGYYNVSLAISGDKINTIYLSTGFNIVTRDLNVVFDTDKYESDENITVTTNSNGVITISKVFNGLNNTIDLSLEKEFEATLRRLLGVDASTPESELPYQFSDNNKAEAGNYTIALNLTGLAIGGSPNVRLRNATIIVSISQRTVDLEVSNINEVFKGGTYLLLTENDIQALIDNGIADPYMDPDTGIAQKVNSLYFGIDDYKHLGVEVIRQKPSNPDDIVTGGKLGLYFPNSGTYNIPIRMRVPNPNFKIGNGYIQATIAKAPVNSITLQAEYTLDGKLQKEDVSDDGKFTMEYNGYDVEFKIGESGLADLENLGVAESEIQFTNNILRNAGTYEVSVAVDNMNVSSDVYTIQVEITKKKIGDRVGKFDSSVWMIDGAAPDETQLENGIVYTKIDGVESVYSINLIDHDLVIAEGYNIRYLYDGKEIKGVSKAGEYKVTAEITRADDSDNWETKIVELWRLDKNGDYVTEDVVIYDKNDKDDDIPRDDDELQVTEKRRIVDSFVIEKSEDLQTEIDALDFILSDKEYTYDGTPKILDYTDDQKAEFARRNIKIVMRKNEFINAGEYTIVCSFNRLDPNGSGKNDPNYEQATVEATLVIKPIQVQIFYEFDEKFKYDKKGLNARFGEGDEIKVTAYYIDMYGKKIPVKSFTIETMSGSGEDLDFGTPQKDQKSGELIITPGNYQITANLIDTNYAYDEEAAINFLRFNIKNETKATNTTLYVLLAFVIFMIVCAALIAWYVFRLYNPACQDIDLEDEENF